MNPTAQQRKEEMYICLAEQGFSAEWQGMVAFDLGVVVKINNILNTEDYKDSKSVVKQKWKIK